MYIKSETAHTRQRECKTVLKYSHISPVDEGLGSRSSRRRRPQQSAHLMMPNLAIGALRLPPLQDSIDF